MREIGPVNQRTVVYVVGDEPALSDLARRTAESLGLEVECFASGRRFLDQYDASRVSCLVTDLKTSDLTGQETLGSPGGTSIHDPGNHDQRAR